MFEVFTKHLMLMLHIVTVISQSKCNTRSFFIIISFHSTSLLYIAVKKYTTIIFTFTFTIRKRNQFSTAYISIKLQNQRKFCIRKKNNRKKNNFTNLLFFFPSTTLHRDLQKQQNNSKISLMQKFSIIWLFYDVIHDVSLMKHLFTKNTKQIDKNKMQ